MMQKLKDALTGATNETPTTTERPGGWRVTDDPSENRWGQPEPLLPEAVKPLALPEGASHEEALKILKLNKATAARFEMHCAMRRLAETGESPNLEFYAAADAAGYDANAIRDWSKRWAKALRKGGDVEVVAKAEEAAAVARAEAEEERERFKAAKERMRVKREAEESADKALELARRTAQFRFDFPAQIREELAR